MMTPDSGDIFCGEDEWVDLGPDTDAALDHGQRVSKRCTQQGKLVRFYGIVGRLVLPSGRRLHIQSKRVSTAGLLNWWLFVDPTLSKFDKIGFLKSLRFEERAGVHSGIDALIACLFIEALEQGLKRRGLIQYYENHSTRSASISGSINFAALARRPMVSAEIPCHVWRRVPNTPLNRFLAFALKKITVDPVLREAAPRKALSMTWTLLSRVPPLLDPDLLHGRKDPEAGERDFEAALSLGRMLCLGSNVCDGGQFKGYGFLLNTYKLFEDTVYQTMRRRHSDTRVKEPVPWFSFGSGDEKVPWGSQHNMQIDVWMPSYRGQYDVILEAKYKETATSGDRQQLLAYCLAKGVTTGFLIIPGTSNAVVEERHLDSGFSRPGEPMTFRIMTLKLNIAAQKTSEWQENMDEFANMVDQLVVATA